MKSSQGTALVTGGAQRIGRSIALQLSSMGYTIALHYRRSQKAAEKTAAEIKRKRGRCKLFQCDLGDEQAAVDLVHNVFQQCLGFNLLVNNASIFQKSSLKSYNLNNFNQHFNTNFKAPYILMGEFAKVCRKGQIVNILDTHIVDYASQYANYLLSKKALAELTNMSALELAPKIRVNGIAPGLILAPVGKGKDYLKRLAKRIPLQRTGDPKNISQAVQFLVENEYLTGQTIFVDGGEHLI